MAIHSGSREEFRGFRQRLLSLIWGFSREDRNRIAGLEFSAVAPRRPARQAGHLARQSQSTFFSAPDYSKVTAPGPEKLRQAPSLPIPVSCPHFSPTR